MLAIIKTLSWLLFFPTNTFKNVLLKVLKTAIVILSALHLSFNVSAQGIGNADILDSLQQALMASQADANRVKILNALSNEYSRSDPRKGMQTASQALSLAKDLGDVKGQIDALANLSFKHSIIGEWAKGLELSFQGIQLARDHDLPLEEVNLAGTVSVAYEKQQDYKKLLEWSLKPLRSKNPEVELTPLTHWASTMMTATGMLKTGLVDSSYYFAKQSLLVAKTGSCQN